MRTSICVCNIVLLVLTVRISLDDQELAHSYWRHAVFANVGETHFGSYPRGQPLQTTDSTHHLCSSIPTLRSSHVRRKPTTRMPSAMLTFQLVPKQKLVSPFSAPSSAPSMPAAATAPVDAPASRPRQRQSLSSRIRPHRRAPAGALCQRRHPAQS